MKTNHCGWRVRLKWPKLSIRTFTRTYSRIPVTHWPGAISRPRVMSILLDWCTFLKELHMINLKSSIRRKTKSNFLSEEFWSATSLRTCYPSTWTSSRPSSIQTTCHWTSIERTSNRNKFWERSLKNFWARQLICWWVSIQSQKMKRICSKTRQKSRKSKTSVLPQLTRRKWTLSTSSGRISVRTSSWAWSKTTKTGTNSQS